MSWKLDLVIVILILAILFVVYLMVSADSLSNSDNAGNAGAGGTTTSLEQTATTVEETTTTADTTIPASTSTTADTTVLPENLYISGIELNGSTAVSEWVEISAYGNDFDMTNYTLKDAASSPHIYVFPSFILNEGFSVKVHRGSGSDTDADLYWNRSGGVWNNDGDTATLSDSLNNLVDEKTCDSGTCWFT